MYPETSKVLSLKCASSPKCSDVPPYRCSAGHILAQGFKAKRGGSAVGSVADLRFDDFSVGNKTAGNLTDSYVPSSHGVTYMLCLYV